MSGSPTRTTPGTRRLRRTYEMPSRARLAPEKASTPTNTEMTARAADEERVVGDARVDERGRGRRLSAMRVCVASLGPFLLRRRDEMLARLVLPRRVTDELPRGLRVMAITEVHRQRSEARWPC